MRTMRSILAAGAGAAVLFALAASADESDPVRQTLEAYEAAWSRHDAKAVASFYFEPAMRVSKGGPVVRPSQADQEAFFDGYLRSLVARGYQHSEWESLDIRLLDSRTALASGVTVRYRADGTMLERAAVTYELWSTEGGWKIFLSATHAPESALHFRQE